MMDVATQRLYLEDYQHIQAFDIGVRRQYRMSCTESTDTCSLFVNIKTGTYQVKMYCAWLFLKLTSAGFERGTPVAWYSMTCI